jgi:hypothetical protein
MVWSFLFVTICVFMKWKENSIKNTLIKFGGMGILAIENMVLVISYFFLASYYILLAINLLM